MIDENLDLSASLFDQHTLFSQILTMKFFDKIKDIKLGFHEYKIALDYHEYSNKFGNLFVSNVKRGAWFGSNQH